ncbi:MAG: PAS domain-containing protein, partial [Anaerolineae bacterium]|nr:PAS domain-containing protein [Anaerolineae bacterium]
HSLILATSTANDLDAALYESMKIICEANHWDYGEIWIPDDDEATLTIGAASYIHPADTGRLQAFWEATQAYQFTLGAGIPGMAWRNQAPSWIVDVQELTQAEFLRLEHAVTAAIHGIVAIPIVDRNQVLAVLVFMARRRLETDSDLLQLLSTALRQIAPIIRRQQITARLVESESKYRTLVDNFDGVITIADADGQYLFANEKAWENFGIPPNERKGKSVYDLFSQEVGDLFVERVQDVITRGQSRVDTFRIQIGSDERWLRATIAPLPDPDGQMHRVQTIAFDVTDAKKLEEQLQQAQAGAHLGSWTVDFQTNETRWSDEFFRICGLEPGSVQESVDLGFSLIHPDDRDRAAEAVAQSQQTGKPYNIEKRIVRPSGEIRWVISQGQ